ncbi:MAG: 23S rRNA (pseudouridine(1915)-N(3))-methyltransferase RlmH [Flavobacteriaceae bacterium]|nr:23S rRNA (pseudouridine(1915)-N(3))-methyltransferase RlmH [Flavobacteriaceae bacterium]
MTITLLVIGKTDQANLLQMIVDYQKRIQHFVKFEIQMLPDLKNRKSLSQKMQKQQEGTLLLKQIQKNDHLILLDENGKSFSSEDFALYLQKKLNSGYKKIYFAIGGPYGFSPEVHQRANGKISLSKMTFSHQMIRLFFAEQLYRAFSILNNLPYHHS